jgi:AmmeMemoRadiSam system protein B
MLPKEAGIRRPAVAGRFYPADAIECRAAATSYVDAGARKYGATVTNGSGRNLCGGIVPHAGWICSGAIAGETIGALKHARPEADLIVVFGAIHTGIPIAVAALDSYAKWLEPGGESAVIEEVRAGLREKTNAFVVDDRFHLHEHAVEVELPLIEVAWPNAAILPVEVPLAVNAIEIGRETARRIMQSNRKPLFLASSDLTHYGPDYGFAPGGIGPHGLEWAKQNDRKLLERVENFQIDAIVPEVATRLNACGGGAIAAMLAACRAFGAGSATVLSHASSYETLKDVAPQPPVNAVGYASVIV